MAFTEILKKLVCRVEGGLGATLMGMDGITVAEYVAEGSMYDVEAVGVEYGHVVEEVRSSSRILKLGAVEEIAVLTHGKDVILRTVTPEYYIAFVVSNGNIGKARYMLKTAAKRVGKEL